MRLVVLVVLEVVVVLVVLVVVVVMVVAVLFHCCGSTYAGITFISIASSTGIVISHKLVEFAVWCRACQYLTGCCCHHSCCC